MYIINVINLTMTTFCILIEVVRKMSGHEIMHIKPSRWSWNRFKDLLNFYVMLGVIPATVVITYINLFIGPAKLVEIPEGYVPEVHEYYAVSVKTFSPMERAKLNSQFFVNIAPNHSLDG